MKHFRLWLLLCNNTVHNVIRVNVYVCSNWLRYAFCYDINSMYKLKNGNFSLVLRTWFSVKIGIKWKPFSSVAFKWLTAWLPVVPFTNIPSQGVMWKAFQCHYVSMTCWVLRHTSLRYRMRTICFLIKPVCRHYGGYSWWRHQMETFSALPAICAGNSPAPVNSQHKGQWRGALMFSLISVWIIGWVNNRAAGDLRRYRAHYDVIVMCLKWIASSV